MPKFEEVITIKETNAKVPIINVSLHPIYKRVSKFVLMRTVIRKT